jgi:hypothetical protein
MTVSGLQQELGVVGKRDNNRPRTEATGGVELIRALQTYTLAYEVSRRILRGCIDPPRSGDPKTLTGDSGGARNSYQCVVRAE